MGFNKKYIDNIRTRDALISNRLYILYSKCDSFLFDDDFSLNVYKLFCEGEKESQIIEKLKLKI
jgi:hypothetical protein